MDNIKIDTKNYEEKGLGDLYYGLISFVGRYVSQNFDPFEQFYFDDKITTKYSLAIVTMKKSIKELLDYLSKNNIIYIPSLQRNIDINKITPLELKALEERCKEYIILKLEPIVELKNNKKK